MFRIKIKDYKNNQSLTIATFILLKILLKESKLIILLKTKIQRMKKIFTH